MDSHVKIMLSSMHRLIIQQLPSYLNMQNFCCNFPDLLPVSICQNCPDRRCSVLAPGDIFFKQYLKFLNREPKYIISTVEAKISYFWKSYDGHKWKEQTLFDFSTSSRFTSIVIFFWTRKLSAAAIFKQRTQLRFYESLGMFAIPKLNPLSTRLSYILSKP